MKDAEIWTVVKGEDGNTYWEHHTTKERRLLYRKGESVFAHDQSDSDEQGPGDSRHMSDLKMKLKKIPLRIRKIIIMPLVMKPQYYPWKTKKGYIRKSFKKPM